MSFSPIQMHEDDDCDRQKYENTWRNKEGGQSLTEACVPLHACALAADGLSKSVPEIVRKSNCLIHQYIHNIREVRFIRCISGG